jgi:hypothetical protein
MREPEPTIPPHPRIVIADMIHDGDQAAPTDPVANARILPMDLGEGCKHGLDIVFDQACRREREPRIQPMTKGGLDSSGSARRSAFSRSCAMLLGREPGSKPATDRLPVDWSVSLDRHSNLGEDTQD